MFHLDKTLWTFLPSIMTCRIPNCWVCCQLMIRTLHLLIRCMALCMAKGEHVVSGRDLHLCRGLLMLLRHTSTLTFLFLCCTAHLPTLAETFILDGMCTSAADSAEWVRNETADSPMIYQSIRQLARQGPSSADYTCRQDTSFEINCSHICLCRCQIVYMTPVPCLARDNNTTE